MPRHRHLSPSPSPSATAETEDEPLKGFDYAREEKKQLFVFPSTGPHRAFARKYDWRPTKMMNMRDLSKHDDFLSHLLVEKLAADEAGVPLVVHKMDAKRKLPRVEARDLLYIVRRLVLSKGPSANATVCAVNELLHLQGVQHFIRHFKEKERNAFATHASRYLDLYHRSGCIEIAHTSRYTHRTGKSELCILATRPLPVGTVITELKGSMANLTPEEDRELKRTDVRRNDIRRDFSVIHSKSMKKNHLFLGPARFVNHDCENNCELFREGKYITFRVIKAIATGEELTAHYGDGYFGKRNKDCLCQTCEKNGKGGYAPSTGQEAESDSDTDSDSDVSSAASADEEAPKAPLNVNERRTRRGVYAVTAEADHESDDEGDAEPDAEGDVDSGPPVQVELDEPATELSELSSPPASSPPRGRHRAPSPIATGLPTPDHTEQSPTSSLSPLSSAHSDRAKSTTSTPFRSIIATRGQKAREPTSVSVTPTRRGRPSGPRIITPPATDDGASQADAGTPERRVTRSVSARGLVKEENSSRMPTPAQDKGKDKADGEPAETRVLRARPVLTAAASDPGPSRPAVVEVPRGPDGKPLPTCMTCMQVLPVISVNSEVIWGAEESPPRRGGRKKIVKRACPRCLRHLAIYGQQWPSRNAFLTPLYMPQATESFASRVNAGRSGQSVTNVELPVLDSKLNAAASASAAFVSTSRIPLKRLSQDSSHEPPQKRLRLQATTCPPPPALGRHIDANRLSTSGPSAPLRPAFASTSASAPPGTLPQAEPSPPDSGRSIESSYPNRQSSKPCVPSPLAAASNSSDTEPPRRKRGRPRLSSPPPAAPPLSSESTPPPKSLAVQDQPRDSHGRFGKKGDESDDAGTPSGQSAREMRAQERGRIRQSLEQKALEEQKAHKTDAEERETGNLSRKRTLDDDEQDDVDEVEVRGVLSVSRAGSVEPGPDAGVYYMKKARVDSRLNRPGLAFGARPGMNRIGVPSRPLGGFPPAAISAPRPTAFAADGLELPTYLARTWRHNPPSHHSPPQPPPRQSNTILNGARALTADTSRRKVAVKQAHQPWRNGAFFPRPGSLHTGFILARKEVAEETSSASETSPDEEEPVPQPTSSASAVLIPRDGLSPLGHPDSRDSSLAPSTPSNSAREITVTPSPRRGWLETVTHPGISGVAVTAQHRDVHYSIASKGASWAAGWPDRDSSSGEEDVILPDSPDPKLFTLRPRASFGAAEPSRLAGRSFS